MTKRFEEVARGTVSELAGHFEGGVKGEVAVVLGPGVAGLDEAGALAAVAELLEAGVPRRRAADVVARLTGVPRNRLYQASL